MAQTGDVIGPAIQAFLQGQQLRSGNQAGRLAERKFALEEEKFRAQSGAARKKSEREESDSDLINQILRGIIGVTGGAQASPAAPPAATPTPVAPQDPFAEFSFTPADEARLTEQSEAAALADTLPGIQEAARQGGASEARVAELAQNLQPTIPEQVLTPTGPSAVAQEQARQQVDLNTPDSNFTITVGGRSVQVSNLKGTPEQKFKRLLAAAKKDAKTQGIDFDIAEFKKIFGDSVLPKAGETFFKRAFRDETTKAIAQRRKDARAAQVKGEKRPLSAEEDLQIQREVFDDAIVRFGGLPAGVKAPEGLESLERTAQVSEAKAFGQELGTGAAKAGGPFFLTSELTKLEARQNGFPQDITKLTALQAKTLLEVAKNDTRTPVSDKFFFAARAAGLSKDVLNKIQNRDFANIAQKDIQSLMAELVKTDSLTALIQQILGSPAGGGVAPTDQTPEERRQELIRKRDAK